jgi:hypothetical protein
VKDPKRNVMLATVLVCLFAGIVGGLEVYLGQRVGPNFRTFPNLDTAVVDVTGRVGGTPLFKALGIVLILATVGAARLPFVMDVVKPRRRAIS